LSLLSIVRDSAASQVDQVKRQVRAAVRTAVLMSIAAIVLMVSLVFVMLGAYESMALQLPRWQAGALVGLGAVVFSLLLVALASIGGRRSQRRERAARARGRAVANRNEDLQAAVEMGAAASAAAGGAARDFLRSHRPSLVDLAVSAFVAGLVASRATRRKQRRERVESGG
jgi:cytochrome c biogenesis protein CcdA